MVAADSKAKLLQDAERYVLHGKMQQAIGEYLKIIKLDPNDVLILNTIGDLYLRQGKSTEASRYFSLVAERYVGNNFLLKAIAVYKKILNSDPNNLSINSTMASLYAKQGLSIDARNQYMRVAALLEKEGMATELMDAYEKIVELDPANSAIQRKLAELYLAQGEKEKSHVHWTGAARAQAKAGNLAGAADSFSRAMQLNPQDMQAMRGFFDCCLKLNKPVSVLHQLEKSVESAPDNLDLREMMGKAHLANKDAENAAKSFQIVFSMDEERYEGFFDLAKAFIDENEHDKAIGSLDSIIPILISHRQTERAVRLYEQILQLCPTHVLAMTRLASIYSATGDQPRYLEELDRIAEYYSEKQNPIEAIEYIEKILQANPESEKHRKLHQKLFSEAYPGTPYVPPAELIESAPESVAGPALEIRETRQPAASSKGVPSEIVEADLLINYGMRDKALSLLLSLESRDPCDKEARLRLLALYKGEKKYKEAAEQCLLLAALYRRVKNEEEAQNYLKEAKQLAPEMAEYEEDLESFARRNGIDAIGFSSGAAASANVHPPDPEVDLSSDLLDIFFSGGQDAAEEEDNRTPVGGHETMAESYPQNIPSRPPSKSVEEQLQEVDFYIRLGFHDEALAKLNEIAKISPDNPALASRYQKLGEIEQTAAPKPILETVDEPLFGEPIASTPPDNIEIFRELELDGAFEHFAENEREQMQGKQDFEIAATSPVSRKSQASVDAGLLRKQPPNIQQPIEEEFHANEMFADLMEEVGALSDQEVSKESFDDHFSLGTAYRDMELSEEAIREFELALKIADLKKDTRRIIQCCGMLSTCFLKKGMPTSALRWCQTGLSMADISSHEAMALRYDMGVAHSMAGSSARALECFDQVFGLDPGYRDVAQKIDELKAGR
jgi:tetratricopeptide (TPR) repeat protein